ncbi:hypothetical protein RJ640_014040 [Escallonia rubra]|uniref:SWI/SNF complex subunit SWI3A n=1 Tax=Escallonia rubra TaxID=112253 RepID=A0AA88UKB3_9ASTE|nr:hypothetical protein RJ640_014040 [Escallonia rubra]
MDDRTTAGDPELDLYTIPSRSCKSLSPPVNPKPNFCNLTLILLVPPGWFSWDDIHETERTSLKEFFDGSSLTRTPKIYKEYRDFIISKYREDPSRRLTFTEVRKSLVGDVSLLHKVFLFLDRWGLINFGTKPLDEDLEEEGWRTRVRVEEGAPNGVRIVAVPNTLKPVAASPPVPSRVLVRDGLRKPPLASYSDVYATGVVCGKCNARCGPEHYEYMKDKSFKICVKCFKDKNYGDKFVDDFKFIDSNKDSGSQGVVWTEAETLLLLESVLKHGDDWELVTQNMKTKSKVDCISKLLELPFGELMFGAAHDRSRFWDANGTANSVKQVELASEETLKTEDQQQELKDESQQNGDADNGGPPIKRVRAAPITDASSLLMKQVALISTMVDPHIAASASEAAITALCNENLCTREILDGEDNVDDELGPSPLSNEIERAPQTEDSKMEEGSVQSVYAVWLNIIIRLTETQETLSEKKNIFLTLRMRAASATALGAAAAHARLLADQEDREIEHLVATVMGTQLEKLNSKIKHLGDLELIMEKEHAQMEELEESLLAERMNVLQRVLNAGLSRWRDHTSAKSQTSTVL